MFGPNSIKTLLQLKSLVDKVENDRKNETNDDLEQDSVHHKSCAQTASNFYKPLESNEKSKNHKVKDTSDVDSDLNELRDEDYYK